MSSVAKSTKVYSGFNPVSIPGCSLWLDAADRNTLNLSGSNVTTWNDKSGNAYTGTAVASPTVVQNAINGLPVIQFNGTSQYINFGNVINIGTSQIYFFAVCKFDSTADGTIIAKSSATGLAGRWFLLRDSVNGIQAGIDATGSSIGAVFASTSTNVQLLMGGWNRSIVSIFQNGTQQNTNTLANTSSLSSTNPLWIGAYPNSTATAPQAGLFLNGKVGEVLVYLTDLTSSQRQQIEGYLAHKWGLVGSLPGTHPYGSRLSITSPTNIPGCALWLDAGDRNTLTLSGSNVTQWNDKSGNGRNTNSVNGTPTWILNTSNNKNGVYFNGTSGLYGPLTYTSNTLSWFVVATVESDGDTFGRILSFGSTGLFDYDSTERMNALSREGTTNYVVNYRNGYIGTFMQITYSTPFLTSSVINGSSNTPFLNGTAATGAPTSGNFNFTQYGISIPAGTLTYRSKGYIFEVLVYSTALSTLQRQQVESYLANKWSLSPVTIQYPYKPIKPVTRAFQPIDVSGCELWLDAADRNALTLSGSNVTTWTDKSSNQYAFSQGTTARQPTYITGAVSGLNVVRFTGSSQQYLFDGNSLPVGTNSVSMFGVIKTNSSSGNICVWAKTTLSAASSKWSWFRDTTTMIMGFEGPSSGAWATAFTETVAANTYRMMSMVNNRSGGSNTLFQDGTLMNTKTFTSDTTTNLTSSYSMLVGAYNDANGSSTPGGYYMDGDICEVIIYVKNLSSSERQQVEGYLATKWKTKPVLPISHPYGPTITTVSSPLSISGCSLWLDAADATTLTLSGANVTTWSDKSGNSRNATAQVAATYNSSPAYLNFTGTNYYSFPNFSFAVANYFSFFIIERLQSATTLRHILGTDSTGDNSAPAIRYSGTQNGTTNASGFRFGFYNNDLDAQNIPAFSTAAEQPTRIWSIVFSTSFRGIYLNGVLMASDTNNTKLLAWPTPLLGRGYSSYYYHGFISEILGYTGVISTSQRQQIETYLANKWGISISLNQGGSKMYRPVTVAFNPLQISGCSLWLDAADPTTLTLSGSNVTQWNDKSGLGRNAISQGTGPTVLSNGLVFTGAQNMRGAANFLHSSTDGTWSFFIALQASSFTGGPRVFNYDYTPNRVAQTFLFETDGRPGTIAFTNTGTPIFGYAPAVTLNSPFVGSIVNTTSNITVYANSSPGTVVTHGTLISASNVNYTIGLFQEVGTGGGAAQNYFSGRVNEIIHFSNALSTYERQQVEGYLAEKWGLQTNLPTSHPYKKITP